MLAEEPASQAPAPLTAEQITALALALPPRARCLLADELFDSLARADDVEDPEPDDLDDGTEEELSPEWRAEIMRRIEEIDSGRVKCVPWEEVKAEARRMMEREHAYFEEA